MRLRRKPWARPELDACSFYVKDPYATAGRWRAAFARPEAPLWLELGCGKGGFVAEAAARCPQANFLAVDIKSEVLALAKRACEREFAQRGRECDNLRLAAFDIGRIASVFTSEDTVERIYINFPNPWPKEKHKKRRLTHSVALEHYRAFLADGGRIYFKTDDRELFDDSLDYFEAGGFEIAAAVADLYVTRPPRASLTEHERMFLDEGRVIYYAEAVKGGEKLRANG